MQVQKRDGTLEPVCLQQIQDRIQSLSYNLEVDAPRLAQKTVASLTDGVSTSYLDEVAATASIDMYTTHPDYERLAVRLTVDNMHRKQSSTFSKAMKKLYDSGRLSGSFITFIESQAAILDAFVDRSRDLELTYFGLKTLMNNKYLLRDSNDEIQELPCFMYLRVAVALHSGATGSIDDIRECYEALSTQKYTHATPTLFNAGCTNGQFASCFLLSLCDDSIEGIYESLAECAKISKHAGGIGIHMHNLRAHGSVIKSTGCESEGLIPTLRVFNESSKLVKQSGKRPGSVAVYLSPDHADVEAFLDMRRNHGDENAKCRELFSALWIPDLFIERVLSDDDWFLFSPDTAPGLADVFGEEYNKLYIKYVEEGRYVRATKARTLFKHIIQSQIETGTPYLLYKDAINRHNNQSNVGVIKSSNLCCEITEVSDPQTVAVCNLASICLPKFVTNGAIDYVELARITRLVVRSLDNAIDRTMYPMHKAQTSNTETRPLGVGVQGWQTLLFKLRIPFESDEARDLNVRIFATIYYHAWMESARLAERKGVYPKFVRSPLSQGKLHADGFNIDLPSYLDWAHLRRVVASGVRHSLITCVMPTASTSQIAGNTEACEPLTSNLYVRRTQAGDYVHVNKYLVEDLQKLGLWNETIRALIIESDGSVQDIDIPDELKLLYKTAFDLSQRCIIDQAADRMPFIDQSQSMNLFLREPSVEKVSSMHMYAFRRGLKTGQYYLRTRARTRAQQLSVVPACSMNNSGCESCSA